MSGTATEGLQPVSDFLPQKPQSDVVDTSDLTPVSKAETTVPGFPTEPRLDAPADMASLNHDNFQSNNGHSAAADIAAQIPSTNGISPPNGQAPVNGISDVSENLPSSDTQSSLPPSAEQTLPQPVPAATAETSEPAQESLSADHQPSISSSLSTQASLDLPAQPTQMSPPVDQAPTSNLRDLPESVPLESETVQRIQAEKHEQDLQRDPELAAAESAGADTPVRRTLDTQTVTADIPIQPDTDVPLANAPDVADKMDTTAELTATAPSAVEAAPTASPAQANALAEELPAPTPTPGVSETTVHEPASDAVMTDTPAPPVAVKVAREREEEAAEEGPASKRAKTEPESTEASFKVPALPKTESPKPIQTAEIVDPADRMTLPRTKHLNKALQAAKKVQCSRFFKSPVDPVAMNIPTYYDVIKEPMDLSTVEKKLKTIPSPYVTVASFVTDVNLMVENALRFNGSEHIVFKEGKELQQRLLNEVANLPPADFEEPTKADKKAQKVKAEPSRSVPARRQSTTASGSARSPSTSTANQSFALTPEGVPLIRRDSTVADGRPKRAIHPPKRRDDISGGRPKKKKFEWQLKFCREVLAELKKPKHYQFAQYFYNPVDPVALNIPNYYNIIKKPMDLKTVEDKLNNNEYEKAKDFEDDVRQVFRNCFKFNMTGDFVYGCGEQLEKVFEDKWATKDDWLDHHEPQSKSASPGSGSEEEEVEEEEEDDSEAERNEKLQQLQKQIEMMSKQMGELANAKKKKKPTPPAPAKKSKKPSSKKDSKSGASFPALAGSSKKDKGSKSKKAEKERFVTYNEKQYISAGISSLPDNRMTEALRIIQSNVPSLKNTHETEIELDIDELPNSVLLKLLAFVKRFVPQAPPEPEPEKSYSGSTATGASAKPKKNKPMSKHEQEAQIEELKGRLGKYGGEQASPEPVQSIEQGDSSGDDSDSEESEEE